MLSNFVTTWGAVIKELLYSILLELYDALIEGIIIMLTTRYKIYTGL